MTTSKRKLFIAPLKVEVEKRVDMPFRLSLALLSQPCPYFRLSLFKKFQIHFRGNLPISIILVRLLVSSILLNRKSLGTAKPTTATWKSVLSRKYSCQKCHYTVAKIKAMYFTEFQRLVENPNCGWVIEKCARGYRSMVAEIPWTCN